MAGNRIAEGRNYIPGLRNDDVVEWRMARAKSRKSNLDNHYEVSRLDLTIVFNVIGAA